MPMYDYRCAVCGDFEYEQNIKESPLSSCPKCGGPVKRIISRNVGLVFKGSGFHITDYVHKNETKSSDNSNSTNENNK
ncbi:FmdB family zinc ribbon protein [Thermovenabulum sp.]|uniref:FmdB family zinc ribbon protein n=1 Tax=Thermovenabulum sp. TaxID=3100335 RepID=UPI003C7ECC97